MAKKFWNWSQGIEDERILVMNGAISECPWYEDDVTPKQFHDELFAGNGAVTIWLNSPGGDCFAASQIYSMLLDYPGKVTVKIDGIAASAASVIAMGGDKILMAPTAMMMIHNPSTIAWGDHNEMEKAKNILDDVKESIINAYEIRTGLSRAKISHLMEDETWMDAGKAIELGFADALIEKRKSDENVEDVISNKTPFAFSRKNSEMQLRNCILKDDVKPKKEPEQKGRSVAELEARLNLIKNFI